jgi:hypothetical protein
MGKDLHKAAGFLPLVETAVFCHPWQNWHLTSNQPPFPAPMADYIVSEISP